MSKSIKCDTCGNEVDREGSRHLEIDLEIDKKHPILFWITIHDEKHGELDICSDCWDKVFSFIRPTLAEKINPKENRVCPRCKGTKKSVLGTTCDNCNGTGLVTPPSVSDINHIKTEIDKM